MGHARALLGAENKGQQDAAWKTVVSKNLSVRDTENLVKKMKAATAEAEEKKEPQADSDEIYFTGVAEKLSRHFGTKVHIKRKGKKGRVEIDFFNNGDLDRLLSMLQK